MALPRMIGGGDFGGFGGYDWLREKRRVDQQPIRGTQIAVTPNSAKATICGRLIDSSVVAGGMGGLPIASGSVGVNNGIPMPAAIKSAGPKINSATQGALQAGGATGAASIPLGVILGDWTDNHAPSWFLGCRLYLRLHGAVNGNPEGDITPGQSATFNTVGGGMGSAQIYDFGLSYLDGAGGESVITWPPGWDSISVPGIGNGGLQNAPATIMNTGPTCTSSYTTGILKRGIYFTEIVTFTESDFSALPSWFDHAAAVVRINGDSAHVLEYPIPNSSWLVNAQDMYATIRVPHHAGQTIDVGLRYYDTSGQASPTTYPAGTVAIADQAGDYFDSGNSYFTPLHSRMSVPVLGTIAGAADAFGAYTKYGVMHRLHFDVSGSTGGSNLLYNPTFANGTTGWTRISSGTLLTWANDAFGGGRLYSNAGSLTATTGFDGWQQAVSVITGQSMVLSGIMEVDAAVAGVRYVVEVVDGAGSIANYTVTATGVRIPFALPFSNGATSPITIKVYAINTNGSSATPGTFAFYKLQLEYGTQPSPFVDHLATANHNKVFDGSANVISSSAWKANVANMIANLLSNVGVSFSSTTTSVSIWITNARGSGLPVWTYPDGSGTITPSAAACGSSTTPYDSLTGMSSGATAYFVVHYNLLTNAFVTDYKGTTAPSDAQMASATKDGSLLVVIANNTTASGFVANGGSGTVGGGGGHTAFK